MEHQYKIRAHHGMCIITQTDAICLKCPNNMQGICETESKVAEYDRQVLSPQWRRGKSYSKV